MKSAIDPVTYRTTLPNAMSDDAGVYLIGNSEHGWYKIGHSTASVSHRVASYRSLPFTIDIEHTWMTGINRARECERNLHQIVEGYRVRENGGSSEWFRLSDAQVALCCQEMKSFMRYTPSVRLTEVTMS